MDPHSEDNVLCITKMDGQPMRLLPYIYIIRSDQGRAEGRGQPPHIQPRSFAQLLDWSQSLDSEPIQDRA